MQRKRWLVRFLVAGIAAACLALAGCSGDDGKDGKSSGTVSGTVSSSATGGGLEGATVTATPGGTTATTAADGSYTLSLAIGVYELSFEAADYATDTVRDVSVVAAANTTLDVTLDPADGVDVIVAGAVSGTPVPGATLTASVDVTPLDGSAVQSVTWTQANSVEVTIGEVAADGSVEVTLPGDAAYKDELFHVISEPPITEADLPPNVDLPPGTIPEQLQDRYGVQALNPFQLEHAGHVALTVTVETDSGVYTDTVDIETELPWKTNPGIYNVPRGIPVLLHGGTQDGTQDAWDWNLAGPAASTASLDDATAQNPAFTPDVPGEYLLTETNSGTSFTVHVGTWLGVIDTSQTPDAEGKVVPLGACTTCHQPGGFAPDMFTPWEQSGHSMIFSDNLNTSDHYSPSCFPCHTVGMDPLFTPDGVNVDNSGFNDQSDYQAFLDSDLLHDRSGTEWAQMTAEFPNTAQLANIQCENCHGPQNSTGAHATGADGPRVSISSDLCGACHGEPARHGRYQQWQVSPHSNFELAIDEGDSGNCSRCHTGNGFIAWEELLFNADDNVTVTWTADTVQPQTCTACHEPHNPGSTSGDATNATVRVEKDTPVLTAGFRVLDAGRGAICMVCHNTRRGLRNDIVGPGDVITGGRAPHGGAQADILMGQNAFWVEPGIRGKHSLITDTCANCHMVATPPPADLSYNLGGTNHTFYASPDICSECHASITADELQSATRNQRAALGVSITGTWQDLIVDYVDNFGYTVTLTSMTDAAGAALPDLVIPVGATVIVENFSDSHGRQAFDVTVDDGVTVTTGHLQVQNVKIDDGSVVPAPPLADQPNIIEFGGDADGNGIGQVLAKAGWNYLMSLNERSDGVHNPSFTFDILNGAQQAVDILTLPVPPI